MCSKDSGAVLSIESSLLSRNFPVAAKNNRELKDDLARNRKKLSSLRQNPENQKIITGNSNFQNRPIRTKVQPILGSK